LLQEFSNTILFNQYVSALSEQSFSFLQAVCNDMSGLKSDKNIVVGVVRDGS